MNLRHGSRPIEIHPRIEYLLRRLRRVCIERIDPGPSVAMIGLGDKAGALHILEDEWLADAEWYVPGFLGELLFHVWNVIDECVEDLIVHAARDETEARQRGVAFQHSMQRDTAVVVAATVVEALRDAEILILQGVSEFVRNHVDSIDLLLARYDYAFRHGRFDDRQVFSPKVVEATQLSLQHPDRGAGEIDM